MTVYKILQGLGVAQAAVTKRRPQKGQKMPENLYFCKKNKNYQFFLLLHISSSYAKKWGASPKWVKSNRHKRVREKRKSQ